MALTTGRRLGPDEILAPLGAGGMGEVYKARDTRLNRDVAIKVLPERVAADPDALARFEREAKAVAAVSPTRSPSSSRARRCARRCRRGRSLPAAPRNTAFRSRSASRARTRRES